MTTQVRTCPRCQKLMWPKDDQIDYPDEDTVRITCPHCQQVVQFKLVSEGANASAPKMGH